MDLFLIKCKRSFREDGEGCIYLNLKQAVYVSVLNEEGKWRIRFDTSNGLCLSDKSFENEQEAEKFIEYIGVIVK